MVEKFMLLSNGVKIPSIGLVHINQGMMKKQLK